MKEEEPHVKYKTRMSDLAIFYLFCSLASDCLYTVAINQTIISVSNKKTSSCTILITVIITIALIFSFFTVCFHIEIFWLCFSLQVNSIHTPQLFLYTLHHCRKRNSDWSCNHELEMYRFFLFLPSLSSIFNRNSLS